MNKTVVVAVIGDTHIGSTLGLCPAEGVMLPDTGRYIPSPAVLWMWENWLDFWKRVDSIARKEKAKVIGVHMGDSVDGDHHKTTQIITADPEAQAYIRDHALKPMRKACEKLFFCRGTEAHVGPGQDDAAGRAIGAQRHPDSETYAAHQWDLTVSGTRIQARHHWNMGGLPWTQHGSAVRLATQLFHEASEHAARTGGKLTYPHVALRGHQHRFADSGNAQPVRVIGVPSWQLATAFVNRVRQTALADVGGIILVCRPDGYEVVPVLYRPDAPTAVVV
jgi:hypothetical protein